jgi:phosphate/phosphite/phosphonate ABC transporter binding protein
VSLLLALACTSAEEPDPRAGPSPDERIEEARAALDDEGVEVLKLGMAPYGGEVEIEAWRPLMEHLSVELDVEIELVAFGPHGELEEALVRGDIHGAQLRPLPYVELSRRHALSLAAAEVYSGALSYDGYIVALKDQSVREVVGLDDLAQTPFGFVHPDSCSGYLFPAAMLLEAGVHPDTDLDARFYSDHRDVIRAVQNGEVLAGAVWSDALEAADPSGPSLRVVAKTPPIPSSAWVLYGLPESVSAGLGAAMGQVATNTAEGRALLAPVEGVHGFIAVDDEHFGTVRELQQRLIDAEVAPPTVP